MNELLGGPHAILRAPPAERQFTREICGEAGILGRGQFFGCGRGRGAELLNASNEHVRPAVDGIFRLTAGWLLLEQIGAFKSVEAVVGRKTSNSALPFWHKKVHEGIEAGTLRESVGGRAVKHIAPVPAKQNLLGEDRKKDLMFVEADFK